MVLDILLFTIILLVVYYCLDDVVGQLLYSVLLVGIFYNTSDFVTIPTGLSKLFGLIIAILALASITKFYWLVKKRHAQSKLNSESDY